MSRSVAPWLLGGGAAVAALYFWSRSRPNSTDHKPDQPDPSDDAPTGGKPAPSSAAPAPTSGVHAPSPAASAPTSTLASASATAASHGASASTSSRIERLPGRWFWPVPLWNGRKPDISSGWGSPRDGGARSHRGADIMFPRKPGDPYKVGSINGSKGYVMPDGLPAVAANAGVVWSAQKTSRGYAVVIDHDEPGVVTFYQHLESLAVAPTLRGKSGERVQAGQVLGIVGGDPKDGAPKLKHLHFEIWRGGGPGDAVDPRPLMCGLWDFITNPLTASKEPVYG